MKRIEELYKLAEKKIKENIETKLYYDKTNRERNKKTLKKVILTDTLLREDEFAFYLQSINTIAVQEACIRNVNKEKLLLILIHEIIHMHSYDSTKQTMGNEFQALPKSYNEACTQYLALKALYGENIDYGKNFIYPESVKLLVELMNYIPEEIIFKGFFKANVKESTDAMTSEQRKVFIDYILHRFSNTQEEHARQNSNQILEEKMENIDSNK